jgi:16S rRNA processing protein RimM
MALVPVGRVSRAVGLKGYLGVAGSDGSLGSLKRIALRRGGEAEPALVAIVEARPQGRIWAVRVEGVEDRSAAEALVGAEVLAVREDLGDAGESRHWWADLEGLAVVTVSGVEVGKVSGLYETGGVDVLVVTGVDGAEKLVPLAPYVDVDVAGGRIVIDPPEGLLD